MRGIEGFAGKEGYGPMELNKPPLVLAAESPRSMSGTPTVLGRPILSLASFRTVIDMSTCRHAPQVMRFTEHNETPASRATSALPWPAFSRISTSCRFNIFNILSIPPILRLSLRLPAEVAERVLPLSTLSGWLRIFGTYNQAKDNLLLFPAPALPLNRKQGKVRCRERLGGLLKYYERKAA